MWGASGSAGVACLSVHIRTQYGWLYVTNLFLKSFCVNLRKRFVKLRQPYTLTWADPSTRAALVPLRRPSSRMELRLPASNFVAFDLSLLRTDSLRA